MLLGGKSHYSSSHVQWFNVNFAINTLKKMKAPPNLAVLLEQDEDNNFDEIHMDMEDIEAEADEEEDEIIENAENVDNVVEPELDNENLNPQLVDFAELIRTSAGSGAFREANDPNDENKKIIVLYVYDYMYRGEVMICNILIGLHILELLKYVL